MLRNQLILTVFRIQVQQVMRLAEHLAALVQLAHGHAHVVQFGVVGQVDEFLRAQTDVVHAAERRQEGDDDGGRRREAADGQRAFDDAADAHLQPVLALQRERGAAEVILDVPLRPLGELEGGHLHHAVLLGAIHDVDALVDGQAGDFPEVVVGMGPDGADAVGTEGDAVVVPAVDFVESVFAAHVISRG